METPNGMHILSGERVIPVGRRDYTLEANLASASRKVRVGQVAQLPDGEMWLRVDIRKDPDGAAWVLCFVPMARRFHGRLVTREDILAVGGREADPARYPDDPDAGFVFPDGSTGGFGLYQDGALIQEDGRDLFAAQ